MTVSREKMTRSQLKTAQVAIAVGFGSLFCNTTWCAIFANPLVAVVSGAVALFMLIMMIFVGILAAERE